VNKKITQWLWGKKTKYNLDFKKSETGRRKRPYPNDQKRLKGKAQYLHNGSKGLVDVDGKAPGLFTQEKEKEAKNPLYPGSP